MSLTDLKEYLEKLKILDIEIKAKEIHISELRQILDALYAIVKNDRMSDLKDRQLNEVKEAIWDFEYQFISCIREKIETKRMILDALESVTNHEYRVILELKYVSLKTWEEIAEITNYSVRNMHYIHKKALKQFAKNLPDKETEKS